MISALSGIEIAADGTAMPKMRCIVVPAVAPSTLTMTPNQPISDSAIASLTTCAPQCPNVRCASSGSDMRVRAPA